MYLQKRCFFLKKKCLCYKRAIKVLVNHPRRQTLGSELPNCVQNYEAFLLACSISTNLIQILVYINLSHLQLGFFTISSFSWNTCLSCFTCLECQHFTAVVESSSLVAWNLKIGNTNHSPKLLWYGKTSPA